MTARKAGARAYRMAPGIRSSEAITVACPSRCGWRGWGYADREASVAHLAKHFRQEHPEQWGDR